MGIIAGVVVAAIAAVAVAGAKSGKKDSPDPAPLPEQPTVANAETEAKEEMKKKRQVAAATGGETDITKGDAALAEKNVKKKDLLGQ